MQKPIEAAWNIFLRDYRVRFRRTFLGILWYLIPVFMLTGMAILIGADMGLYDEASLSVYLVKVIAGLIVWQVFVDSWNEPLRLGRRARTVLRSVILDHQALLIAGVISMLIGFLIRVPILTIAQIITGNAPSMLIFIAPLGIFLVALAGVAFAGITLPLSLNFLDMRYGLPVIQVALLLLTPILYDPPTSGIQASIMNANPLTHVILPVRDVLIGASIDTQSLFLVLVFVSLFFAVSMKYFRSKIRLAIAYIGR